jgi:ABC-2 type transport system permease protein
LVLAFLIIALLAIMTLSLGLSVSGMATRPEQAMQVLPAIVTLPFLLSGVFWPLEAVPTWLRPVSWISPLTYAVNAERDVMLRGWGVGQIWPELVVMAVFTITFIALSVFGLGRSRA